MNFSVYNTLTNKKEAFSPLEPGKISLYTCGPTVYDFAHLGNFRSYVAEDIIKRYLLYLGYQVQHVMNITDIDDKTIRKANELNVDLDDVTDKYIRAFMKDITTLNILPADVFPRATEHISEMEQMVEILLKKGHAYKKDGSVYFKISSFPEYGRLANIDAKALKTGTSVDSDEYDKENVQDFVLWKGKRDNEPSWSCSFGEGRPGWHIECSAMSTRYLGNHFDIHMGGVDNIFPHHENEIAQAECASGKTFVNFWIHVQHLIVDRQKMSKSLGNFYTLRDLMSRGHDPMAIRYLLLSTHYRKLLNFTFAALEQSKKSLKRIEDFRFTLKNLSPDPGKSDSIAALISESEKDFQRNMNDDFNISGALGSFFEFIRKINPVMDRLLQDDVAAIDSYLERINSVLGVFHKEEARISDESIMELIRQRDDARKKKDFATADSLRDKLKEMGIQLIDTPDGVKWKVLE